MGGAVLAPWLHDLCFGMRGSGGVLWGDMSFRNQGERMAVLALRPGSPLRAQNASISSGPPILNILIMHHG